MWIDSTAYHPVSYKEQGSPKQDMNILLVIYFHVKTIQPYVPSIICVSAYHVSDKDRYRRHQDNQKKWSKGYFSKVDKILVNIDLEIYRLSKSKPLLRTFITYWIHLGSLAA
jgi:hypothetical protein